MGGFADRMAEIDHRDSDEYEDRMWHIFLWIVLAGPPLVGALIGAGVTYLIMAGR